MMSNSNKGNRPHNRPKPNPESNPEGNHSDNYDQLIEEAEELQRNGQLEPAIHKFEEARDLRPQEVYPVDRIESLNSELKESTIKDIDEGDFGPNTFPDPDDSDDPRDITGGPDDFPPAEPDDFPSPGPDDFPPTVPDDSGPNSQGGQPSDREDKRSTGNSTNNSFVYYDDRSYFFVFGPRTAGKTVIISSLISYLNDFRNVENGSSTICLNNSSVQHEKIGLELYNEVMEMQYNNEFPKGTLNIASRKEYSYGDVPGHVDLRYIESGDQDNFDFCLMDMAGEDLQKIKVELDEPLPESIRTYIEDVPKKNMCFLYVLNPDETIDQESKAKKAALFNSFIQLLDSRDHTSTPVLILVSKWDTIENQFNDASEYIKMEFPSIWGKSNEGARDITITSFSYGKVEDAKPVKFNPKDAKKVFEWMYKTQNQGYDEGQYSNKTRRKPSGLQSFISKILKKNG